MPRSCPHCGVDSSRIRPFGFFVRKSDRKRIARFFCRNCKRTFSRATFQSAFRQNKRFLNPTIRKLLVSCVSKRRIAKLLQISRTTVDRKAEFLGLQARIENRKQLQKRRLVSIFQFDDLETFEHTKLKPLSVVMAVEKKTRHILGFRVAQMPAKGKLAALSRKKYGRRPDHRAQKRRELFEEIKARVVNEAEIWSDESPHYPNSVKEHFPKACHKTTKGRRGCVVGQGELKAGGYDPLFTLNHTFAMLRANINRLARRTWCTTKKPENLALHIELYVHYHNSVIVTQI